MKSLGISSGFILFILFLKALGERFPDLFNIPNSHMTRHLNTFFDDGERCRDDVNCSFNDKVNNELCWGYEPDCPPHHGYSTARCPGDHKGWVSTKAQQLQTFFEQADFGYVRKQRESKKILCQPHNEGDSLLECSDHLQFCRGSHLYLDFRDLPARKELFRYKMDVLKEGQIGGKCQFNESLLTAEPLHLSPLQSWAPEIQHFKEQLNQISQDSAVCDIFIEKPTFIIKIDATVNMYHHFCDFFNLYVSLHVNGTHKGMFSRDINILIWETYNYSSNFGDTWSAFTQNPLLNLRTLQGKRVCFREIVFPLLPRMIFGLYYNTPVIWGCLESGLFHAFSQFILHRLKIAKPLPVDGMRKKINVTLLSRKTPYRRILNEEELLKKLSSTSSYNVRKVEFTHNTDFKEQLEIIQQTDILIGMHGAGLTHLLFLPDWAAVFELYNCGDEHCYADLARLRGVHYETWTDPNKVEAQDEGHHPGGGAHAKFTNYAFDSIEFLRIVDKAATHITSHLAFRRMYNLTPSRQLQEL